MALATQETINIGDLKLTGSVYIPPMAGYTDLVYRRLCRDFDPDVLMSTEMLSSKSLIHQKDFQQRDVRKMDLDQDDPFTGIQIFGHEPEIMARAAELATSAGAKFIDINMGCPVAKIVSSMDGAALMREPELAEEIVKSVIKVTHLPVTVKTRLGWDYESLNAADLARRFEDAGVKALTIHGRTRSQKYQGSARWDLIKDVVDAVNIPVFANGDIRTIDDAAEVLEITGARGVAIARGTMGKPWFSKQINHFIRTGEKLADPDPLERCKLAIKHATMLIEYRGDEVGSREARKHVVNYTSGLRGASKMRAKLSKLSSIEDATSMINELIELNS